MNMSVVIPSAGRSTLKQCVTSVKDVIPEAEVIVVGKNNILDILSGIEFEYIPEPESFISLSEVFNAGFRAATRDYILWLNDDAELIRLPNDIKLEYNTMYALGVTHTRKDTVDYYLKGRLAYYADFGIFSRKLAAILRWWDERYSFYSCDADFACKIWDNGGRVKKLEGSLVYHDAIMNDEIKTRGVNVWAKDEEMFHKIWGHKKKELKLRMEMNEE